MAGITPDFKNALARLSWWGRRVTDRMPKGSKTKEGAADKVNTLKGWKEIAEFLGQPLSVVKRWRSEGMPVNEEGRFVSSSPEQLSAWLGRETGKPVHVITAETDLGSELKRAIVFARQDKKHPKL
jgi:hypothetical protein